jgi:predicted nuclease of restriction endonuclease-like (RecB) superfamily
MNLIFSKYQDFVIEIKKQIASSQQKAALSVNKELILLYWNIGKMIFENQSLLEGRNNFIDQLAKDIKADFPFASGFSRTNLFNIIRFYNFYADFSVQQAVGLEESYLIQQPVGLNLLTEIPWSHHVLIIEKTITNDEALFYLNETKNNNWSRSVLSVQLKQNLFQRQDKAINNFDKTLQTNHAALANQILKGPYNFDFLTLEAQVHELEIEKQRIENITKFLLELGKGFAFIGRQYPLKIGKKTYSIDLLFYHIRLRSFVVIELKTVEFEPEFAGKLNFYLSAVDDLLKTNEDNPSIGILLCNGKEGIEVKYALKDINKPIGVSEYTFTEILPKKFEKSIPTVDEFEQILNQRI